MTLVVVAIEVSGFIPEDRKLEFYQEFFLNFMTKSIFIVSVTSVDSFT